MVCGSTILDKPGCLSAPPKSPASTAGNSTPATGLTPSATPSIIADGIRNEALVLSKVTWKFPLSTPRDVARLSRAICRNNALLIDRCHASAPVVAWRLFQAADRSYNGFVMSEDVNRILTAVLPTDSLQNMLFHQDNTAPRLLWDVMIWWRSMKHHPQQKLLIERYVFTDLVVPSDGLWAGIGLNATIRVWKNVCRCVGHLFRYHAENALSRLFQSIRDVNGRVDIVLYLIRQSLSRISEKSVSLWDDMFSSLDLSRSPLLFPTIPNHEHDPGDPVHFVDHLDLLEKESGGLGRISNNVLRLPGTRDSPTTFGGYLKHMLQNTFRRSHWTRRSKKFMTNQNISLVQKLDILRFLIKQFLDIEQWRGQYASALDVNDD